MAGELVAEVEVEGALAAEVEVKMVEGALVAEVEVKMVEVGVLELELEVVAGALEHLQALEVVEAVV